MGIEELFELTMMRRLPKFGCGVLLGICTTLVAVVEAIPRNEGGARVLELDRYRLEWI